MKYTSIHISYLFLFSKSGGVVFSSISLTNYGFSLLLFAVHFYIFLVYLFFSVLFLYNTTKVKTLNDLQVLNTQNFTSTTIVLIFLSFAGIPPLLGFISKFLIFNFLFITQRYMFLICFLTLNFYAIYFYIQNLRFIISKNQLDFFLIKSFYFCFSKLLINIIVCSNFFNSFGFLYVEDALYSYLCMFVLKGLF